MPARYELWDFSYPTPTCRGRFPTRRHAYRMALRLGIQAVKDMYASHFSPSTS